MLQVSLCVEKLLKVKLSFLFPLFPVLAVIVSGALAATSDQIFQFLLPEPQSTQLPPQCPQEPPIHKKIQK
jgi:hypothetical protein